MDFQGFLAALLARDFVRQRREKAAREVEAIDRELAAMGEEIEDLRRTGLPKALMALDDLIPEIEDIVVDGYNAAEDAYTALLLSQGPDDARAVWAVWAEGANDGLRILALRARAIPLVNHQDSKDEPWWIVDAALSYYVDGTELIRSGDVTGGLGTIDRAHALWGRIQEMSREDARRAGLI